MSPVSFVPLPIPTRARIIPIILEYLAYRAYKKKREMDAKSGKGGGKKPGKKKKPEDEERQKDPPKKKGGLRFKL